MSTYLVTNNDASPNVGGTYLESGTWAESPAYTNGTYWLFWNSSYWVIATELGNDWGDCFYSSGPIVDAYSPQGTYSGTPWVALVPPLQAGDGRSTAPGPTTVTVWCEEATGGFPPYIYQWYRDTTSGFTPGAGNLLAGKTDLILDDTGLEPDTDYYYVLVVTDSADGTDASNEVWVHTAQDDDESSSSSPSSSSSSSSTSPSSPSSLSSQSSVSSSSSSSVSTSSQSSASSQSSSAVIDLPRTLEITLTGRLTVTISAPR